MQPQVRFGPTPQRTPVPPEILKTNINSLSGFTIIEIVMVILLLAILATISIPNFFDLRDDAKTAITKDEMAAIKRAITGDNRVVAAGTYVFPGYESDVGALPSGLTDLVVQPAMVATYDAITRLGWRGPYLDSAAISSYQKDAWGTDYVFSTSPREVESYGPNKADGGGDDIVIQY